MKAQVIFFFFNHFKKRSIFAAVKSDLFSIIWSSSIYQKPNYQGNTAKFFIYSFLPGSWFFPFFLTTYYKSH